MGYYRKKRKNIKLEGEHGAVGLVGVREGKWELDRIELSCGHELKG